MIRPRTRILLSAAAVSAIAWACGARPAAPTSPSSAAPASANVEDPVTLKASAPVPQAPINDALVADSQLTLTASAATATFTSVALQYQFQVINDAGAVVQDSGPIASPSFTVTATLDFEK